MKLALASVCLAGGMLAAAPVAAQDTTRSLDLTVNDVGISIGDSRRTVGLRLNFRDRHLEEVIGVNATIWSPYEYTGTVRGLALGLPLTGARRLNGIGVGVLGLSISETMSGISVGGLGVGAGSEVRGIAIGGFGVGAGDAIRGIAIGGLGAGAGGEIIGAAIGGAGVGTGGSIRGIGIGGLGIGAGGDARGLMIGGLGAGVGGDARGLLVGGLGAGVGQNLRGLAVAGLGFGVGENVHGITIAGVGTGAGGHIRGVQLAGLGIGAGESLRWVSIAGGGVGSPRINGLAIATVIGAQDARGVMIAPAYLRIQREGTINGINASAFNHVRGTQQGLALGIFNYARVLDGVQVGLLNYAANKSAGTRLLPVINIARAAEAPAQ